MDRVLARATSTRRCRRQSSSVERPGGFGAQGLGLRIPGPREAEWTGGARGGLHDGVTTATATTTTTMLLLYYHYRVQRKGDKLTTVEHTRPRRLRGGWLQVKQKTSDGFQSSVTGGQVTTLRFDSPGCPGTTPGPARFDFSRAPGLRAMRCDAAGGSPMPT
jgi:hypothetical protein